MSSVAVLIPWAGRCPHRHAAFAHVCAWYAKHFPDWQICVGEASEGADWCRAEAIRNAVLRTRADILVIADADSIAPHVGDAVNAIRTGTYSWAVPHRTVHRLNAGATQLVIRDDVDPADLPRTSHYYAQLPYTGYAGGGVAVLGRETYAQCPLDPRFVGWGQEDESWAMALRCLAGDPWRPTHAPLWHLWHPPQNRSSRAVGSVQSKSLRAKYRSLSRVPELMKQHIEPARSYVESAMHESGHTSSGSVG